MKEFIIKKEIGDIFRRRDLLNLGMKASPNTINTYRAGFQKAGVLKTIKPGIYKKIKNIRKKI